MTPAQKKELKRIFGKLEGIYEDAGGLADALKEAWEEKPEKWRESEAGMDAEKEIDDVRNFADALESAMEHVTDLVGE